MFRYLKANRFMTRCTHQTYIAGVLVLGLLFVSLFSGISKASGKPDKKTNVEETISFPVFYKNEIQLIKTLSSQNYINMPDLSNHVSGNAAAIDFGKRLFFSKKLSDDETLSCASCHNPKQGWGTHDEVTIKRSAYPSTRHVPSLWGVKYNRWYFWDGRADSLWSQALQPIEDISEMAGSRVQIARLLITDTELRQSYEAIFGDIPVVLLRAKLPVRGRPVETDHKHPDHLAWVKLKPSVQKAINRLFSNVGKSIAAFEETLISTNSPFDQFAAQLTEETQPRASLANTEEPAFSASAAMGLKLFVGKAGCISCHFGPNFSDGEFHHSFLNPISLQGDLGRYDGVKQLLADPFNGHSEFTDTDQSKRNKLDYVYLNVEFRGQFKTPSLRNVATTFPYMHTGEFRTLGEVVHYYNTISKRRSSDDHQEALLKSLELSKMEEKYLVAFLESLSDSQSEKLATRPD